MAGPAAASISRSWCGGLPEATLNFGCDEGLAVSDDYTAPFNFQGKLGEVVIELPDQSREEAKQAARAEGAADLARQ